MKKALKVGITGGIGAGKSIVAKLFTLEGIPHYDADARAKWLVSNDSSIKDKIIEKFGPKSYTLTGVPDRAYLANEVFNDSDRVKILNELIHPKVGDDFNKWYEAHLEAPFVLKEAALLFESGSYKNLDRIITVVAPIPERIKRVLFRDSHRNEAQVKAIIEKQLPQQEKANRSDFVIKNGPKEMVIPQMLKIYKQIISETEFEGK